ncbi:hypothetical protein K5X82_03240 [Halosquirtibacter xylanolyticus]|uniref:hypothetical protein n=1 Tax=Halosquirtibacter xylanolyticus TaxID=3374599 RepID=UPI003748D718|nr:hypothetical protein K5X82_03240 [Prolixibacteraceae bacterium]
MTQFKVKTINIKLSRVEKITNIFIFIYICIAFQIARDAYYDVNDMAMVLWGISIIVAFILKSKITEVMQEKRRAKIHLFIFKIGEDSFSIQKEGLTREFIYKNMEMIKWNAAPQKHQAEDEQEDCDPNYYINMKFKNGETYSLNMEHNYKFVDGEEKQFAIMCEYLKSQVHRQNLGALINGNFNGMD